MESRSELLNKQAEKKDKMLDLIQHCSKISQGLDKMPVNAGDRAIWELVQNACDLSNQCHVRMTLTDDEFVFAHKGWPFTYETLSSLIRQVSSSKKQIRQTENGEKPTVGQYGTGFLTTHKFGKVIELQGSMDASLEGEVPCYVELCDETGKGFVIDREFDSILSFVDKMGGQIEAAKKLLQKETFPTPSEWTEFHYKLTETTHGIARKALEQARKLMPFVIAINPKIEEVEITDEDSVILSRVATNDVYTDGYLLNIVEVGVSGDENRKVYSLCSEDKSQMVIIPPTKFPPFEETPSLFLYYPLLGSEDFGVNFIFHSANFEATELRDGIILPSENENTKKKYEQNMKEMSEMVERLTGFLKTTVDETYLLSYNPNQSRVFFPKAGTEEQPIDAFYKKMKELFVSTFEQLTLFELDGKKVSIASGKVKVIHSSLLGTLTDEKLMEFEKVLLKYAVKAYPIPQKNPIEWSRIVDEWNTGKDSYFISCKDICETIKENSSDLLMFIRLLNETEHQAMLNEFAIIPNRDGELCRADKLKYGKTIGEDLFRIAKPLLGDKAKEIVDDAFHDVYPFTEYNRTLLRDDISTYLGQVKKETIDEGKEFSDEFTRLLLEYCSYNPTTSDNSFKSRLMPYICELYDYDYAQKVIPSVEPKEVDMYETPFSYLVESSMIHIAAQSKEWVIEHLDLLYGLLDEYSKMTENKWKEKLTKYAVVPNENNTLCLVASLKKNKDVDERLIDYYQKVKDDDLNDGLVKERFSDLFSFEEETALNVSTVIQNELEKGNYQNRIVIDIIERLEAKEWEGLFASIYKQRESIRYNLGSEEEKKQINRLMRRNDVNLLKELANVAETGVAIDIIEMGKVAYKNSLDEHYIKWLGEYVERNLYRYLKIRLNEAGIDIRDEQGGQDYILSKTGHEDYRVEVKSRWSTDDSVEMSSLQVETAVKYPSRFALMMVSMYDFDKSRIDRDDEMRDEEIESLVKVSDNIGVLANDLYGEVDTVFKKDDNVKAEGAYSFRVKQAVFKDRNLGIGELVENIKGLFRENV